MNYHCGAPDRLKKFLEMRDKLLNYTFSGRTNRMLSNEHSEYKA